LDWEWNSSYRLSGMDAISWNVVRKCVYVYSTKCLCSPRGVRVLPLRCVCVCVSRGSQYMKYSSCCCACINTLLGLSKLSVNWGGTSWCAAMLSPVTHPVCAAENKSANFWNWSRSHTETSATTLSTGSPPVLLFGQRCSLPPLHFSISHSQRWISSHSAGALSFTLPSPSSPYSSIPLFFSVNSFFSSSDLKTDITAHLHGCLSHKALWLCSQGELQSCPYRARWVAAWRGACPCGVSSGRRSRPTPGCCFPHYRESGSHFRSSPPPPPPHRPPGPPPGSFRSRTCCRAGLMNLSAERCRKGGERVQRRGDE